RNKMFKRLFDRFVIALAVFIKPFFIVIAGQFYKKVQEVLVKIFHGGEFRSGNLQFLHGSSIVSDICSARKNLLPRMNEQATKMMISREILTRAFSLMSQARAMAELYEENKEVTA